MPKRIVSEEPCPEARAGDADNTLKVTDENGRVHFVPKDPLNRDYRAVLEFREKRAEAER